MTSRPSCALAEKPAGRRKGGPPGGDFVFFKQTLRSCTDRSGAKISEKISWASRRMNRKRIYAFRNTNVFVSSRISNTEACRICRKNLSYGLLARLLKQQAVADHQQGDTGNAQQPCAQQGQAVYREVHPCKLPAEVYQRQGPQPQCRRQEKAFHAPTSFPKCGACVTHVHIPAYEKPCPFMPPQA